MFCKVQNLETQGFQLTGSLFQQDDLMRDRNVGEMRIDDLYNLENFNHNKENNTLVTLYWYLYGCTPYPNTGVEYCLFVVKVFQNLEPDKLINSIFSFYTNLSHRS